MQKLKLIFYILFSREKFGILLFKEEPLIGDTISVGRMIAEFNKKNANSK